MLELDWLDCPVEDCPVDDCPIDDEPDWLLWLPVVSLL
jgi:hypothetical protein